MLQSTVLALIATICCAVSSAAAENLGVAKQAAAAVTYPPPSLLASQVPQTPDMTAFLHHLDNLNVPQQQFGNATLRSSIHAMDDSFDRQAWDNPGALRTAAVSYAKWAGAAYCLIESNLQSWNCGAHCTGGTEGTHSLDMFYDLATSSRGYVAVNDDHQAIIASFRGTLELQSFVQDVLMWKTGLNMPGVPDGAEVHHGFLNSWNAISTQVKALVQARLTLYPNYKVYLTGHSLGGAIAALAAIDLQASLNIPDSQLELYTFGTPRVGNSVFSEWFTTLQFPRNRLVHENDIISQLPPKWLGYEHYEVEYYNHNNAVYICNNGAPSEDSLCSDARFPWVTILAHLQIFDVIFGPWC
ncbi:hypothetical protein RI367_000610 [Sorochytrium milnesiophthora]